MSLAKIFGLGDWSWDGIEYVSGLIDYSKSEPILVGERFITKDYLIHGVRYRKTIDTAAQEDKDFYEAMAELDKEFPGTKDW